MPRGKGKRPRQKGEARTAYLVRPYVIWPLPVGEAAGYYRSLAEAEAVRRELEGQFQDETLLIEEYAGPDQVVPRLIWPRNSPEQ